MLVPVPLACFLSLIRPPGVQFEDSLLQIAPVDKSKCPFIRDKADVAFQLYTRHNPTTRQELIMGDDEVLASSNIDFNDNTVIYFHAFMENPNDGSAALIRESYVLRGDTNVILVDAQRLEAGPWYLTAAENTWYIGRFAAQFIDYLVSRGLNLKKTHLIGHSLGAQAAGVAGSAIQSGRVSRITGLDPALPLFNKLPLEQKLDPSDAMFVDVIHTDAGIFGVNQPVGHVDFYPNGGISPQPGCELEVVIPQQLLLNKFFCSHWRSYEYYAESVLKPASFMALSCPSWRDYTDGRCAGAPAIHMGYGVNPKFLCTVQPRDINSSLDSGLVQISCYCARPANISGEKKTRTQGYYTYHLEYKKNNKNAKKHIIALKVDKIRFKAMKNIIEMKQFITDTDRNSNEVTANNKTSTDNVSSDGFIDIDNKMRYADNNKIFRRIKRIIRETNNTQLTEKIQNTTVTNNIVSEVRARTVHENDTARTEIAQINAIEGEVKIKKTGKSKFKKSPITLQNFVTIYRILKPILNSIKNNNLRNTFKKQITKRTKRFIPFLNKESNNENFIFRMLHFLIRNRKSITPIVTVMKEIDTLVKSANGVLSHSTKERNNYFGGLPSLEPMTYNLELGADSRVKAFVNRLLGKGQGDRLTITGSG